MLENVEELERNRMMALKRGTGLGATEAGGGVADLRAASEKRLACPQQHTTGKRSHFELKMPYLRLSVTLQEEADALKAGPSN